MASSKLFNVGDVVEAFEKTKEDGQSHGSVVSFDWTQPRNGPNGCKYVSVFFDIGDGPHPAVFRFEGEKHVGKIAPHNEQDAGKKRDRHPCLQFQKWNAIIPMEADGITIKQNDKRELDLPADEKLSPTFKLVEYLDEAFESEISKLIENEKVCMRNPRKRSPHDAIIVPNTKVVSMVQRFISTNSTTNAGCRLPNPIMRMRMKCDYKTGMPNGQFFDKSKSYADGDNTKYEPLVDENSSGLNIDNISKLILPGSIHDGICNASSICSSSMGLSYPLDIEIDIVQQPSKKNRYDQQDVYAANTKHSASVDTAAEDE